MSVSQSDSDRMGRVELDVNVSRIDGALLEAREDQAFLDLAPYQIRWGRNVSGKTPHMRGTFDATDGRAPVVGGTPTHRVDPESYFCALPGLIEPVEEVRLWISIAASARARDHWVALVVEVSDADEDAHSPPPSSAPSSFRAASTWPVTASVPSPRSPAMRASAAPESPVR